MYLFFVASWHGRVYPECLFRRRGWVDFSVSAATSDTTLRSHVDDAGAPGISLVMSGKLSLALDFGYRYGFVYSLPSLPLETRLTLIKHDLQECVPSGHLEEPSKI